MSGAGKSYQNVEGVGVLIPAAKRSITTIIGMLLEGQLGREMVISAYSVDLRKT